MVVEKKKTISEIMRRYLIFTLGIMLISYSGAWFIKGDIGVSPVLALPYTFSLIFSNISVGIWVAIFSVLVLLLQLVIRRRRLKKRVLLLQLFTALALGLLTELSLDALREFNPMSYKGQLLACIAGSACLAGGFYLCHIADLGKIPMESFMKFVAKLLSRRYATVRLAAAVLFSLVAAMLSLVVLGSVVSVREGTLFSIIFVTIFLKIFMRLFRSLEFILLPENRLKRLPANTEDPITESHFVITVSHEYGSGGRTIAKRIAHELALPYYDSDVIQMATDESGDIDLSVESHERTDSKTLKRLYNWYTSSFDEEVELTNEQKCRVEAQIIQEIASKNSCVILGRLANYVLQNHENSLHIFITADEEDRIKRVMRKEEIERDEACDLIYEHAKEQKKHCQHFSETIWGNDVSYDIMIKSSKYGVDRTAAILLDLIKEYRLIMR